MANNRLYLVHAPTGVGIGIGKRMGWGWYVGATRDGRPMEPDLNLFYDHAIENLDPGDSQDDFVLVREDTTDWDGPNPDPELPHPLLRFKRVETPA
jgi:hypothetical protein